MAGISSDILSGMLRTNLNNLKSFAEQLNAELTEDEHENDSRDSHKSSMSQILQKFSEAEAYFVKGENCLQKVEREVKKRCPIDVPGEVVAEAAVTKEINTIMSTLAGKDRFDDNFDPQFDEEGGVRKHWEDIRELLSEIHPLELEEDGEGNVDSAEENRMVNQLEEMQKRALAKTMKRVVDTENDEDHEPPAESIGDSDEEDLNIPADAFERVESRRNDNRNVIDVDKFDKLFTDFQKKVVRGSNVDSKELYSRKIDTEEDIDPETLPLLSKYSEKILDLFSREAIVVMEQKQNFTDPITKTAIQNPVRNRICDHVYERNTIYSVLKGKKSMACPLLGCSCRSFTAKDLVEDEELAIKISQSLARERESMLASDAENASTDDEANPDDDTQSQEIL